jgi:transcriptional regulator with XRE-family HTH domain
MNIAVLLKLIRKANKWTLRQMAQITGLSVSTLNRCESGKPLDQANLGKVIRWLFS